jgi:class 3 adenylate cyclase
MYMPGKLKKVKRGEDIFLENDYGRHMYIIRSGQVKIYRIRDGRETVLSNLIHGDFFGEMAVFTGLARSASAQAITDCELQVVDKEAFIEIVKEPVIWRILQKMCDRIREFDDKVEDLLIEDELRKVVQLFRRYVAPQVVDEILKTTSSGQIIDLSGELREVTVLFADIRNFTTIAEKLEPHKVVQLLNTYLGEMTHVVFRYDGTVDKYIGDAVMAIFNAPIVQKDHALLAVKAAKNIQTVVASIGSKKDDDVAVGVGINTGKAILGNIGTDLHLDYTVVGDAVNVASRLCRVAAAGELLISGNTYKQTQDYIIAEEMPAQKFKGKTVPINIYKVLDLKQEKKRGRSAEKPRKAQKL